MSCADVIRDGRRAVRRRRFGVSVVLLTVLTVLGGGAVLLRPEHDVRVASTTSAPSPAPPRKAMTIADAERFSVLLRKSDWLDRQLVLTDDSGGQTGQFRLIEDTLRFSAHLDDLKGHTGSLVITISHDDGQAPRCTPSEGCKAEQLKEGRMFSFPKNTGVAAVEREVVLVTREGLRISAVVTDSPSWPMLTGTDLVRLTTELAQSTQR